MSNKGQAKSSWKSEERKRFLTVFFLGVTQQDSKYWKAMECGRGVGINLLTGSASAHYCSSTAYGLQAASSVMNYGLRGYFPPDPVGDAQPYLKPFATREHQQESLALEQHIPVRILTSIPPPAILQFSARRLKEDRGVAADLAAAEQGPAVSATAEKTELAYSIVDLHQDPAVTEQENSVTGKIQLAS